MNTENYRTHHLPPFWPKQMQKIENSGIQSTIVPKSNQNEIFNAALSLREG
jgi:hypothetical protein